MRSSRSAARASIRSMNFTIVAVTGVTNGHVVDGAARARIVAFALGPPPKGRLRAWVRASRR